MKEILQVRKVSEKKYEIVWSDDSKDIVCQASLPDKEKIMLKSPVLSTVGPPCEKCKKPTEFFYQYRWVAEVSENKIEEYNRNIFEEIDLAYVCNKCYTVKFPWESPEDEHITIANTPLSIKLIAKIRLEEVPYDPSTCEGCRKFAIGPRQGNLLCMHYPICDHLGCTPLWVHVIRDRLVITLDDIIRGKPFVYLSMELPFWSP